MLLVYIAGPYRAQTSWRRHCNIMQAEAAAFDIASMGLFPLVPHKNTEHFDGELSDNFWLEGYLELLRRCDAVFALWGWKTSRGATTEITTANMLGIPVLDKLYSLECWKIKQYKEVKDGKLSI